MGEHFISKKPKYLKLKKKKKSPQPGENKQASKQQ